MFNLIEESKALCAKLGIEWNDNAQYVTLEGKRFISGDLVKTLSASWENEIDISSIDITISAVYPTPYYTSMATAAS